MLQFSHHRFQDNNFSPYLLADTGIAVSTINQSQQYLHLSPAFRRLAISEQLHQLFEYIQQHMQRTGGQLKRAGYIRRYYFVYDKGMAIEINPVGQIIATHEDFDLIKLPLPKPRPVMTQVNKMRIRQCA